jgi:hypothetical protein
VAMAHWNLNDFITPITTSRTCTTPGKAANEAKAPKVPQKKQKKPDKVHGRKRGRPVSVHGVEMKVSA